MDPDPNVVRLLVSQYKLTPEQARAYALQVQSGQAPDGASIQRMAALMPPPPPPQPTENDLRASRVAFYNQAMEKKMRGETLSKVDQDYIDRVHDSVMEQMRTSANSATLQQERSTLAGRKEREAALRALDSLKYRTPGQDGAAALDARYAQRNLARRDLGATGLPPALYPAAQAQTAGWTTPYQYPAPLAVPMRLEK